MDSSEEPEEVLIRYKYLLIFLSFVLTFSCGKEKNGFCITDEDCPGGICESGECTEAISYLCEDLICPENLHCREGICITENCLDIDCPDGEACAGGICLPVECEDMHCGSGVCLEGRCVSRACAGIDCDDGELCAQGTCYPVLCDDMDCPAGHVCHNGICSPAACAGVECPESHVCGNGRCYPEDCDYECPPTKLCHNGICVLANCVDITCYDDLICGADGNCHPPDCVNTSCQEHQVCVSGECRHPACAGAMCSTDEVCDPDYGVCRRGCFIDGVFHNDRSVRLPDRCAWCVAESDLFAWRNLPAGTDCGGGLCDGNGECLMDMCPLEGGGAVQSGQEHPDEPCRICSVVSGAEWEFRQDGYVCGETHCGEWTDCLFEDNCTQTGEETRTCHEYRCENGVCRSVSATETRACERNTEGMNCGEAFCGNWGECSFSSECDVSGQEQRVCREFTCRNGQCIEDETLESRNCSRPDTEGMNCGAHSKNRCCNGACVDISTNTSHCGGCNTPCASGYSCEPVSETTECSSKPANTSGRCRCDYNSQCARGQICRTWTPYPKRCTPPEEGNCAGQFVHQHSCPNYCRYP